MVGTDCTKGNAYGHTQCTDGTIQKPPEVELNEGDECVKEKDDFCECNGLGTCTIVDKPIRCEKGDDKYL